MGGALAAYSEGLDISRALTTKDPGNTQWQGDVELSFIMVGDVLVRQGDLAGALAAFRKSLDIQRALAANDPGNARWRRGLSISLERVGNVLRAQGDLPGALAAYRECLDIRRELAAQSPGNAGWQMDVVVSLRNLALSGDNPRVRSSEALVILKQLNSQGRLAPAQQGTIAIIEGELAKLAQAKRQ